MSNSTVCAVLRFALLVMMMALPTIATSAAEKPVHIVAFGDSLTAGFGLPPGADFASRLEARLKAAGHAVRVTNAGVSGDTTAAGLARFDWAIPEDTDAVILELGANDALRGIAPKIARDNLNKIMGRLTARGIPVLIAGMRAPANWGASYRQTFDDIFPNLATRHGTLLYGFFLDGVIDRKDLKLADGLHPNEKGVDAIVRRIEPSVAELIARARARSN